jgi:ribosomal protein S18 acetylase RimI-like enzyme
VEHLDNPIWHALTTEQAHLAERDGDAARFPPSVTALAGLREPGEAALAALAGLVAPGELCGLLLEAEVALPARLAFVDRAACAQMVHEGPAPESADRFDELGPDDAAAMLALAEATRPGPFGLRTGELGTFLGLRAGGTLVAMAGQRMRLPGMIEISGVCTDPAHLGRGHGARLMTAQLARIRGAGAAAFLHVKADNARAIALYERLGFRTRRRFDYLVLRGKA